MPHEFRDCAPLTIPEAAARLAVPREAARSWRRQGVLEPAMIGRRHAVTRRSVEALARELGPRQPKPARHAPSRPYLRLVVDNT